MSERISASFRSRSEAERAAQELIARGVPETSIEVKEEIADAASEGPPSGPSLGGGVTPEATNALIEAHEDEVPERGGVFVLSVDTMGDPNREAASREVFGYIA